MRQRWALVLLQAGWYALVPPTVDGRVDVLAPLGRWEQLRAFDSAEACEKMTIAYAREALGQTDNQARARARGLERIRCISAADPRLRP